MDKGYLECLEDELHHLFLLFVVRISRAFKIFFRLVFLGRHGSWYILARCTGIRARDIYDRFITVHETRASEPGVSNSGHGTSKHDFWRIKGHIH